MVARAGFAQHYTDFAIQLRLELNTGKVRTKAHPVVPTTVICRFPTNATEHGLTTVRPLQNRPLVDEDAVFTKKGAVAAITAPATTCERKVASSAAAVPEVPEATEQTAARSNISRSAAPQAKGLWWRFKWRFRWPICQFLDQCPMTFKDLHIAIAQRHPKHCPGIAKGKIVSFANMGWLHELERDLQKVAINLDGVWHLKEGISEKMPRHGTRTRYSRYGCTCSECTTAYSRWRREKFERTGN
jgi:hypothetical protein